MRSLFVLSLLAAAAALPACGKSADGPPRAENAAPAASPYLLSADPGAGLSVLDAKKAGPTDDVVVVARVKDVALGFAAFTLADTSLKYCGFQGDNMPECETPWDYCCTPADEIVAGTLAVAVKDASGETVALPRIAELRNLDLVAVRGRLVKDADGELKLEAKGWYRRERPVLPDSIKFP